MRPLVVLSGEFSLLIFNLEGPGVHASKRRDIAYRSIMACLPTIRPRLSGNRRGRGRVATVIERTSCAASIRARSRDRIRHDRRLRARCFTPHCSRCPPTSEKRKPQLSEGTPRAARSSAAKTSAGVSTTQQKTTTISSDVRLRAAGSIGATSQTCSSTPGRYRMPDDRTPQNVSTSP
jgi:hypothetical protein